MKNNKTLNRSLYQWFTVIALTGGLWLKIIYTQLSIKINNVPIMSSENTHMFLMALLSVAFVMLILLAIGYKLDLMMVWLGALFLNLIVIADLLYGRYYYNPISVSIFDQLYMFGDVSGSALTLIKWKDIIFLLDFMVLLCLDLFRRYKGISLVGEIRYLKRYLLVTGLLVAIGLMFTIGYNKTNRSNDIFERKNLAKDLGLLYYHGYDVTKAIERASFKHELTLDEREFIEENNHYNTNGPNAYTGVAEGYNLIVIQVEALMNFLIDYEVDGREVTPFMNRFKNESLYLSNTFVQTANGNTVDAELMMNTSLMPSQYGAVYYEYSSNTYQSLPLILAEEGYQSYSFHSYDASFWNREVMHKKLGFARFFSYEDFDMDEKTGWALSDRSFLRQSLAYSMEKAGTDPFYSFMITLSSHHPYDGFITGPFSEVGQSQGLLNHYYNAANYVDQVLEEFVQSLEEKGLMDNTVLVIYGDHSGLFNEDAIKQSTIDGVSYSAYSWTKYQQVPVIIHCPDEFIGGLTIDGATGQYDIMPTVANLLGIKDMYTLGSDVLDPNYKAYVIKRYGDVITDDYIYIYDEGKVYDYETGETLSKDEWRPSIVKAHEVLNVNDLLMSGDYFAE